MDSASHSRTDVPVLRAVLAPSRGRPIAFGPEERTLFGFHHAPAGEERRRVGVVLCNPFGYEAMCAYRTYRHLAEHLATAGFHALRFDYHGTGDSAGFDDEPNRTRSSMLDAIHAAAEELKARAQISEVVFFGVRLGALLAAQVATERDDVTGLILFGTPLSGRAYVRELRAFGMLKEGEDTALQVAGYSVDGAMQEDLKALDPLKASVKRPLRVLIVPRDDVPGEERVAKQLAHSGNEVNLVGTPGYAKMMRDVEESIVPTEVINTIVEWAAKSLGAVDEHDRADQPRAAAPRPLPVSLPAIARSGTRVREHPVRFGPEGRLFGIITTPGENFVGRRCRNAVLFLNVGANHHVGSGRLYVTMARELAGRGITAIRFDASGLGESYAASGMKENQIYSMSAVTDVQTAMTLLQKDWEIDRFVVVGICSGAHLAFHSAAADARVVGQVLMNLSIFEWKEGDTLESRSRERFKASHVYGRTLFTRETWMRMLKGRIATAGIARYLLLQGSRRVAAAARSFVSGVLAPNRPLNAVERDFWTISDRGATSLLLYSADDAALDTLATYLGPNARRMRRRKNFQMQIVEDADHTFTELRSQRQVGSFVVGFIAASFT